MLICSYIYEHAKIRRIWPQTLTNTWAVKPYRLVIRIRSVPVVARPFRLLAPFRSVKAPASLAILYSHVPSRHFSHGSGHLFTSETISGIASLFTKYSIRCISFSKFQLTFFLGNRVDQLTTTCARKTLGYRENFNVISHYENMPIQIYWNFYNQKMKIFR